MSTYSEYGYTVSASTDAYSTTGFYIYKAFNNTQGNEGWHAGEYNDGSSWYTTYVANAGGAVYDTANYSRSIAGIDGEWLKLEMPHKLVVDYITLKSRGTSGASTQSPKDFKILGSNDDVNWDVLESFTSVPYSMTGETHVVGATKAYKYLVIVVTRLQNTGNAHLTIGELSYHGHKENDLVRFPDSVNVLKYPHITVDEPAKRGYAVSQSSQLLPSTGGSTGYYHGYNVFDREVNIVNRKAWISMNGGNSTPLLYDTNGDPTAAAADTVVDGTTTSGEWVQLKLPHKIKLSYLRLMPPSESGTTLNRAPKDGVLAGSTDGTTWTAVSSWSGASYSDLQYNTFTANIDSTNSYDYLRLIVKKTGGATLTSIQELEFYGTEPEDVIARVGEGLDGKVANFRVYDKYLHEEQALELWDAQKDQFGRAESSVVVHKGRLGVGTTEPEGRFAVLDEAGEMGEFPPRAMTAEETYMEGHGVFGLHHSGYNASGPIIRAFNKKAPFGDFWYSNTSIYQGTGNLYSGSAISPNGVAGEWMYMTLPYHVDMKYLEITARNGEENSAPNTAIIFGSADGGVTWEQVGGWSGKTTSNHWLGSGVPSPPFTINSTKPLNAIGFVVTHGNSWYAFTLGEIRFFGTRERGQSVLHDGQLTLTKNLTVPRIGPALDADDTPRRDRLVVEYNTFTNPTANGTVKDTSGRGNDGLFYGGASYDATEKALVFDGSNDYLAVDNIHNPAGDWAHSVSVWLKMRDVAGQSGGPCIYSIGQTTTNKASLVYMYDGGTYDFIFASFGDGIKYENDYDFMSDTWYHMCFTYSGGTLGTGSQKAYVNGVELGGAADYVSGNGNDAGMQAMNLDANAPLYLSKQAFNYSGNFINGLMSNFKLYECALTADEVKRLYDMGRCDEGHHVVNFSKTRVGIGLGDGEAPRAALDVRGNVNMASMRLPSAIGFHAYNSTSSPITWSGGGANIEDEFNSTYFNYDGCYNTTTGRFTAPVKGIYGVQLQIRTKGSYYCVYVPHYNSSDTFQYHVINQAEHDITSNNGHRNMAGFVHMDKGSYLLVDSCGGSGEMFIDTGGWSKFVVVLIQETE
jgi:hypothetical protein